MSQNHHRHHSSLSEKFQKTKMILDFRNFIFLKIFNLKKIEKLRNFWKCCDFFWSLKSNFKQNSDIFNIFENFRFFQIEKTSENLKFRKSKIIFVFWNFSEALLWWRWWFWLIFILQCDWFFYKDEKRLHNSRYLSFSISLLSDS